MFSNSFRDGLPLQRAGRALLAFWGLLLASVLALAYWLDPDPSGLGTHQQLGLPPCVFLDRFGFPCPTCGMTTSFAHFVRAQFVASFRANAAGLLLAVLVTVQIPWSVASAVRGRLCFVYQFDMWCIALLSIVCCATILQWGLRIAAG